MEGHQITRETSKFFTQIAAEMAKNAPQILGSMAFLLLGIVAAFLLQYLTKKIDL